MQSNDRGPYQGDLYYDSLKKLADSKARDWANIACDLGFAPVSEDEYWREDRGGIWRLRHFSRLFLILVGSQVEQLEGVRAMFEDVPSNRKLLQDIGYGLHARGITFYTIPYDILSLLVLAHLRGQAKMRVGDFAWRDDIQQALHDITGAKLSP